MSTIVYGKNAVRSSLLSKKAGTLYIALRLKNDSFTRELLSLSPKKVVYVSDAELKHLAQSDRTQGYCSTEEDYHPFTLNEVLTAAKEKPYPLLAMLDGIEDPHNLGAIIRSADAFGVDGIIIKSHGEVPVNGTVSKVSTGAIDYVKVVTVTNLNQTIATLKKAGYWIVSSDGEAKQDYDTVDYKCPICVVVGSEGFGVSRLVLENSDFLVKIPMCGHVNSLNASVAASIFFAEISRNRRCK
jgi:23S rRNA (guanosine2251-2'-O)-methyltransferase